MSQIKTLNGVQYTLPQYNDTGWGANTGQVLTQYLAAIADVTLQLSGGAFTLTADANFGATYGLVSAYFTSRTTTPATAGAVRLAKTDVVSWRNNANGANIDLSKDTSDNLKWNATKILLSGAVVNADINAAAAIAYTKLALTGSIVNADMVAGTLTNTAINAAAAIALSKLASTTAYYWYAANSSGVLTPLAVTASKAVATDSNGLPVAATTTATELGYVAGVTSAIQTQMDGKAALALSNLASVAANIALLPGVTNSIALGSSSKIWSTVFAALHQAGLSGTAGTIDVYPTTAAKGKLQIAAADSAGDTTTAITNASQAGARTYTIPDAGASASFVMTAGTQTVSGTKTFDGQLIGKGTATNDSAAAGYIGEYLSSKVAQASHVTSTGTGQYFDVTSLSLTAGDWDVTGLVVFENNGAGTFSEIRMGISVTSGNSATGLTFGDNLTDDQPSTATGVWRTVVMPAHRVSISGTTTHYLKAYATYGSSGPPQAFGRISARRVR